MAPWFSPSVGISSAYLLFGASIVLSTRVSLARPDPQTSVELEERSTPSSEEDSEDSTSETDTNQADPKETDSKDSKSETDGTASSDPLIVPPTPKLISSPQTDYLPTPQRDVEIILELLIGQDGQVKSAEVVSGLEPYASAALSEAPNWTFDPATRDGSPTSARIHFLVTFPQAEQEPAPLTAEESQPNPSTQPPPRASGRFRGEVLDEVVVLGDIGDPGATEMSRLEVNNLAGAFGDPLRAVESMPGVTPIVSGLPLFFIRGAPPGNVGYFIDGIRVPLLYHAFLGPSVLHPAMIDKVSLSAGPMAAEHGRFAGAAVEAHVADVGERRVEGSIRLIDTGAFAQSRFAENQGYVQLSGRYSYTALLISLFSPGTRLDYWDYQARVGYALSKRDELSVMALGAYDYIGTDGETLGGTEYHRIDIRWDRDIGSNGHLRTALTWGRDRTRTDVGTVSDMLWGARMSFEHSTEHVKFRSGLDVWLDQYGLDLDPAISEPENFLKLFPERTDVSGGAFVDVVLDATDDVRLIPGLRFDHFTSLGQTKFSVDPRISAELDVTDKLTAIHSLGTAHQSPNFVPNVPGAQVGGLDGGLQRTIQAAAKYEYEFPWNLRGSVALFMNGSQNLTDPVGLGQSFSIDETSADSRASGRAYGMEFYLKRPLTRRLGGFLSYTYSTTLRSQGSISTRAGYDRPHVFNGALSYDFGWNVRASLKLAVASGILARETTLDGFVFRKKRSHPYVRLDAKVEKRFIVSEHLDWGIALEVLNATYTGNVTSRNWTTEGYENLGTAPITFPLLGADVAWK